MAITMDELMGRFARPGRVEWIGLRPGRREALNPVESAEISAEEGLVGDHWKPRPKTNRQVTLIQKEHIDSMAQMLGRDRIDPGLLRRNIVVSGLNLLSLKGRTFRIGTAVLEMTGNCHPCSRMEENLGEGGYNTMRGHGGITARVISAGSVSVGDEVLALEVVGETAD